MACTVTEFPLLLVPCFSGIQLSVHCSIGKKIYDKTLKCNFCKISLKAYQLPLQPQKTTLHWCH